MVENLYAVYHATTNVIYFHQGFATWAIDHLSIYEGFATWAIDRLNIAASMLNKRRSRMKLFKTFDMTRLRIKPVIDKSPNHESTKLTSMQIKINVLLLLLLSESIYQQLPLPSSKELD